MSVVTKNLCLEAHVTVEKYFTYPLQEVAKNLVHHIAPNCKADFAFHNRLLLVAQSIISLIALPFKMIFAIFSGIDTMFHPTDEKSWVNLTFAFTTVALHAVLVPAGIVLAFIPETGLDEIVKIIQAFDKNEDENAFETAFKPVADWLNEYKKHIIDTMPKSKAKSRAHVEQEPRAESVSSERFSQRPVCAVPMPSHSETEGQHPVYQDDNDPFASLDKLRQSDNGSGW